MSAQAGIYYFDGRPVPPDVASTLTGTLAPYGPDGGGEASPAPGMTMVSRRLQVTPEDRADVQPVELSDGAWLTWDGRLDNRTDLMMELGMRVSGTVPDVHVVAQALARWSDDTWRRLVGDWSAALWDPGARAITLASDFMGVRPLYYVVTEGYCAWSTALEGLVALTGRRSEVDDVFFVCSVMRSRMPGRTPYRGIHAVVSGHRVRIERSGGVRIEQYWHLPQSAIRYRDPRDYQIHLRTVFRQALTRRLRSDHPVWMELSGGWDSSSIVCMAARIVDESGAAARELVTASYVAPRDPESDETRFIEAVEAHVHLPSVHVEFDRTSTPVVPNTIHFRTTLLPKLSLYERMRGAGARILMSGRFGDGALGNFPVDLTDATTEIRSLRPIAALRELRAWSLGTHETAWSLLRDALGELLPKRLIERRDAMEALSAMARATMKLPSEVADVLCVPPASMSHFFAARALHVRWRLREQQAWRSRHFVDSLALYALNLELSSPPEAQGIVFTYPLADRDLVDYVASIPARILCEPGRPRSLMRDALGSIVPERTRRRFSKGHATPFRARLVRQQAATLLARLDSLDVVTRGYVDPNRLRAQLQSALVGGPHDVGLLLRVLLIENWLSALSSDNSAAA